jgi:hypothetical protein
MEKRVLSGIEGRFDVDKLMAGDSGDKIHRFRHNAIDERAMVSPSKAKCNSSAGRVRHNPGEGVVSVESNPSEEYRVIEAGRSWIPPQTRVVRPESCTQLRESAMLKFPEIGSKEQPTRVDWPTCALKYTPRSLGYQKFRAVLDKANNLKQYTSPCTLLTTRPVSPVDMPGLRSQWYLKFVDDRLS